MGLPNSQELIDELVSSIGELEALEMGILARLERQRLKLASLLTGPKVCFLCGGAGQRASAYTYKPMGGSYVYAKCEACDGTGQRT